MISNNEMHVYDLCTKLYVLFLWYGTPMLRGQSSLWYTTVTCFMISQLPGMPVATCSDPTRDLLWCRPRPHHHVILCHVHTHAHGPVSMIYVLTMNHVLKIEMILNMFSCLLDALSANDFRNDFRKTTTYRMYIYVYVYICMRYFKLFSKQSLWGTHEAIWSVLPH